MRFEKEPGSGVEELSTLSMISVIPRTVMSEAGVVKNIIRITATKFKANLLIQIILDSRLRFFHEMSSAEGMLEDNIPILSSFDNRESSCDNRCLL